MKLIRPAFIKIPVLSRASAWFTHWGAIEKVIRDKKIDVIILYSVPTNGIQALRIAKAYGVPVVFRSIDVLNQLVHNKFLSKITRVLEWEVCKKSDLILTINPALSRYVIGMGANQNRVKVLPLGVDTDMFRPDIDTTELRQELGIKNTDKVIVFVGTLPRFSGLDNFIHIFSTILKEVPEARLLIVGDGEQRNELERLRYSLGKDYAKVIITGYQSHERIPEFINLASVCIMPFEICGATKDIFPTKVIQYMACGKPVVSTRLPGLVDTVRKNIHGIVYTDNWVADVVRLLKSDSLAKQIGRAGLEYVKRVHSYDEIVYQLEKELGVLVNGREYRDNCAMPIWRG